MKFNIKSGYHGHHDAVWVSVHAGIRDTSEETIALDPTAEIPRVPFCTGV